MWGCDPSDVPQGEVSVPYLAFFGESLSESLLCRRACDMSSPVALLLLLIVAVASAVPIVDVSLTSMLDVKESAHQSSNYNSTIQSADLEDRHSGLDRPASSSIEDVCNWMQNECRCCVLKCREKNKSPQHIPHCQHECGSKNYTDCLFEYPKDAGEQCEAGNNYKCKGNLVCGRYNEHDKTAFQCCEPTPTSDVNGVAWCQNAEGQACFSDSHNNCKGELMCINNKCSKEIGLIPI